MTFLERTLYLIEKNGITKNKLLLDLQLGKNSFVNWESRGTIPTGDTISKIADYFQVSADYLLGRTDDPNQQPGQENITFDEFTYAMYNESKELTNEDKQMLLDFARRLKSRVAEEKRLNDED